MYLHLGKIFNTIRFNVIRVNWKPADHSAKPIFLQNVINKYWSPSTAIDIAGQNSQRNLTDESLAYDLPFLLAEKSGIRQLDLSNNLLGHRTVTDLNKNLFLTKIKTLNLSNNPYLLNNPLEPEAIFSGLMRGLTGLSLSHCNLLEKDIDKLISALKEASNIIDLDISNNNATPSQLDAIDNLLMRNRAYHRFKNEYQKKDILDLERYPLDATAIKHLAFYISRCTPVFFFESSYLKEIKAPILAEGLTDADFGPLIEALKQNNRITTLTMDFRQLSAETEQKIRVQLMFNKARQKMRPSSGIVNYAIGSVRQALVVATLIGIPLIGVITGLSFWVVLAAIISRLAYNGYFFSRLQQAKSSDFSRPENRQAIERGRNSANSWLSYLNPKTYTPMAYLGYTIEKENLSAKYDIKLECFKPRKN